MTSQFIWYELLARDADAAAAFYGEVIGWKAKSAGQEGVDYRLLQKDDVPVGGLMTLPPQAAEAGVKPGWFGYVSVDDVDAEVASFVAAGGAVCMPAMDIPGIGRMALVADPQGATLYVMKPLGDGMATSFAPKKPGHGGFHELRAKDSESAFSFYRERFGWGVAGEMDMGPMGKYRLFHFDSGNAVGAMFDGAGEDQPYWLYYFNVADIEAARERVKAAGGEVTREPHEVPTGDWILHARDPDGVRFALVGPKVARDAKAAPSSKIAPCLWFNGEAEDAAKHYVALFPGSAIESVSRYGEGAPFPAGTALMVEFSLAGQRFQALNGGPNFTHSEAISLSISAKDAAEVDHYWSGLLEGGGVESQCGWLKDRFGVSWQVVPEGLGALLSDPDSARAGRAIGAMMKMSKLDLAAMRAAADKA